MAAYEPDKIERLKRKLYAPNQSLTSVRRSDLPPAVEESSGAWPPAGRAAGDRPPKKRPFFLLVIFFIALIFFLAAAGTAAYVFFRGGNLVSPANVDLLISGPETVAAGGTVVLQILVANRNPAALEAADLVIEYPTGTRSPTDLTKSLTRGRSSLGQIKPGATAAGTVSAAVFGEKDATQEIKVTVEYRLADSNAIFDKTAVYRYQISDSPLRLSADWPAEVATGQVVTLALEVTNNSAVAFSNLGVLADYPSGFIFQSARPAPAGPANNFWRLGDLAAGGQRRLTITGLVAGQPEDLKSFRFSAGPAPLPTEGRIDLVYGELFKTINIKPSSVGLNLTLNGAPASDERVASSGELLRADILWVNNLPMEVLDGRIEARLSGEVLDERQVAATDGFWQSADRLIVWQARTKPELARLAPSASGQASFTFSTKSLFGSGGSARSIVNPNLELLVRFTGRRIAEGAPAEEVVSQVSARIKINSVFQLAAAVYYRDGPFANSGSLPPKVGAETTYTIVWSVINSSNAVRDGVLRATLPTYVRWLGLVSPASENITFNESTGEVVWALGAVEAGRGLTTPAREAAFQIAFRPSVSQVGESPVILGASTLAGTDTFTGEGLTHSRRPLDTRLLNDSQFRIGDERIAP